MAKTFYHQLIRILQDHGYEYLRPAKGSHEIWWNPASGAKMSVPRNCKSKFTANGILKSLNIDYRF